MCDTITSMDHFTLHFQPVVQADRAVIAAEALLRFRHPQQGILGPASFSAQLDAPESARFIGRWVLDRALRTLQSWIDNENTIRLAINISPTHLLDPCFVSDLEHAIDTHGRNVTSFLDLELTESAPIQDFSAARSVCESCNSLGFRLSLDDFGTGFSTLSWLQQVPVQTIKIDRSFVTNLPTDRTSRSIVQGALITASQMGLFSIAEGVETEEQCEILCDMGCDALQGYLFSRPMAEQDFRFWLGSGQRLLSSTKETTSTPQICH